MPGLSAAAFLALSVQGDPAPIDPIGRWINPGTSVIVEIAGCGERALCGWVRWASDKAIADAKAGGTDPLIGTQLFRSFVVDGEGRWKGKLFIPDLRQTHSAEIHLIDDRRLRVRGCAMAGLICKSQTWIREAAPAPQ